MPIEENKFCLLMQKLVVGGWVGVLILFICGFNVECLLSIKSVKLQQSFLHNFPPSACRLLIKEMQISESWRKTKKRIISIRLFPLTVFYWSKHKINFLQFFHCLASCPLYIKLPFYLCAKTKGGKQL